MARKFSELEAKMSPQSLARSNALYRRWRAVMRLPESEPGPPADPPKPVDAALPSEAPADPTGKAPG